jgi:dTMP kinase
MPYYIFEGPDGVGKSTAINNVANRLRDLLPDLEIVTTQLPGTTPIGQHIRRLVKTPESIDINIVDINPLTRQILYAADYASFVIDRLQPDLIAGKLVICDRCSAISSLMYGHADGVCIDDLWNIYNVIPKNKAETVFVLNCEPELAHNRVEGNREKDHFDFKPIDFKIKVHKSYKELTTDGSAIQNAIMNLNVADRIVPIDASECQEKITSLILTQMSQGLGELRPFAEFADALKRYEELYRTNNEN